MQKQKNHKAMLNSYLCVLLLSLFDFDKDKSIGPSCNSLVKPKE